MFKVFHGHGEVDEYDFRDYKSSFKVEEEAVAIVQVEDSVEVYLVPIRDGDSLATIGKKIACTGGLLDYFADHREEWQSIRIFGGAAMASDICSNI